jgi:hypothetical protein
MDQNQTGLAAGNGKAGEACSSKSSQQVSDSKANGGVQARSIAFHPLADIFPLMEGEEFDALVADIKANGLQEDIVLYQGKILDGRNRYRACLAAGIVPCSYNADPFITDPAAYVISANVHRRHLHLTTEQKRDLIAEIIKAQPEKSDRQVARMVKASPTTIGTVRGKLEKAGDVSKLDTRRDSKGRKQPAKKASAKTGKPPKQAKPPGPGAIAEMAAGVEALRNRLAKEHGVEMSTSGEVVVDPRKKPSASTTVLVEHLNRANAEKRQLETKVEALTAERNQLREEVAKLQDSLRTVTEIANKHLDEKELTQKAADLIAVTLSAEDLSPTEAKARALELANAIAGNTTANSGDGLDIPDSLRISAEDRRAAWERHAGKKMST